jgi:predicted RNA polymerase sigma factor
LIPLRGSRTDRPRLQAAIAACHAQARTPEATDWGRIVALYDVLAELQPSPIVELNRAVAVGMAFGPEAGLELVDALVTEPAQGIPSLAGGPRRPPLKGRATR